MKLSKNFYLQEFVTPDLYKKWKDKSIIFIDDRLIHIAQFIRDRFNKPMTINNWNNDGSFRYRGYRPYNCRVGAHHSQHKYGRAIDFTISRMTIAEIHEDIKANKELYYEQGVRVIESIELAPTWMHIDCRFTNHDQILWF